MTAVIRKWIKGCKPKGVELQHIKTMKQHGYAFSQKKSDIHWVHHDLPPFDLILVMISHKKKVPNRKKRQASC